MALYEINEFLTLNDVAEYLTDKCNYDFNLNCSTDQNRLIETIIQLVRNDKLNPVFHYSGSVDWLEKKVITSKSGRFTNHEMVSLDINYGMSVRDYYFVSDKNFDKLIENNYSNYINVINSTIESYHVEGKQKIFEDNILYYREIKEDFSITFHDLLYPKLDLDKLFNQTEVKVDTEVIEKLREQVAYLTAENDRLNKQLSKAKDAATGTAQTLDWQNMSEHIYPPELHLALMIWQRIYIDNELKNSHISSHGGKFEVIAKKIGLTPDNTLGNRVAMLINTAHSKNKQDELADQLRAIEQLHMPLKIEKTTT